MFSFFHSSLLHFRGVRRRQRSSNPAAEALQPVPEPGWYWTQHPLVRERINSFASGNRHGDVYMALADFLEGEQSALPLAICASIGCGTGGLERDLLGRGLVEVITGFTNSEKELDEARRLAAAQGLGTARYEFSDPTFSTLPQRQFDAVFSHGAISHAVDLEEIFTNVARALKPDGLFHLHEYVGPSRFQWSDEQVRRVNAFIEALPDSLRRTSDGLKPLLARPQLDEVSLAPRSAELRARLAECFDIVEERPLGGGLLHMALGDIAQNFAPTDSDATARIRQLMAEEDDLTRFGALGSDFSALIARQRGMSGNRVSQSTHRTPSLGMAPTRQLWPGRPPRVPGLDLTVSRSDTMLMMDDTHYVAVGESALDVITSLLGEEKPNSILDLPCGFGRVTRALRAHFPQAAITVSDLDRPGVDFTALQFGARGCYSVRNFDELDLEEEFDLIWVGSLMTHLPADTTKRLLAALGRHLTPGGTAFVSLQGPSLIPRLRKTGYGLPAGAEEKVIAEYGRIGFGYQDYAGGEDLYGVSLTNDHYGISLTGEPWMRAALEECGLILHAYLPQAWDTHHDVAAIRHPGSQRN